MLIPALRLARALDLARLRIRVGRVLFFRNENTIAWFYNSF
jgi:hypothetical protein